MSQKHRSSATLMNRRTLANDNRRLARLLKPGMAVLDVGCGSGTITADIARVVQPHGSVLGIDRDSWQIEQAHEMFPNRPGLRFACQDILEFECLGSFDVVAAARCLHWVADIERALARMAAVTRPGGVVLVLDFSHERLNWTPEPPEAVRRFYRTFLVWRERLGLDNALADHLPGLFARQGLTDIQVSNEDISCKQGHSRFQDALDIVGQLIVTCGPTMVADGLLGEQDCVTAYSDYEQWCRNNAQSIHYMMRAVEGRRPRSAAVPRSSGPPDPSVAMTPPVPFALPERSLLAEHLSGIVSDLVAIPSALPEGDTSTLAAYTASRLRRAGYVTEVLARTETKENVVARMGHGSPCLVFLAPGDTRAIGERSRWTHDPLHPVISGDRIEGLGTADAKGCLAVHLWLAEEIARRGGPRCGEVVFATVADSRIHGPDGTWFLREAGLLHPDGLIIGQPTGNQIIRTERGVMWVRLTCWGDPDEAAALGSETGAATSAAILRMARLITRLRQDFLPRLAERQHERQKATLTLGTIQSAGTGAGHDSGHICVLDMERRLLPSEKVDVAFAELLAEVEAAGEPDGMVRLEFLRGTNGFVIPANGPLIRAFSEEYQSITGHDLPEQEASGISDGRYFAESGTEIIGFGPGSPCTGGLLTVAPTGEHVAVSELFKAAILQFGVVARLLGFVDSTVT